MSIVHLMQSSYNDAQRMYRDGSIDDTDWQLYQFYWRNGAPRFSEVSQRFELKEGF